jgi:hypothetical protein
VESGTDELFADALDRAVECDEVHRLARPSDGGQAFVRDGRSTLRRQLSEDVPLERRQPERAPEV